MYIKSNSNLNKILVFLLNGLSIIFKTISFINLKIKSIKPKTYKEAFIVSIDNLSFGGTGKTTLVTQIGEALEKDNIKFAVVTRGYKSKYEKKGTAVTADSPVTDTGDEAKLLKKSFKNQDIFVGKNRHDSIKKAIGNQNKIIILDDGFQSTDIVKDLKIMLVNPDHHYYYLRNFKFLAQKEDIILNYDPGWESPILESDKKQKSLIKETPLFKSKKKPLYGVFNFEPGKFFNQKEKEVEIGNSSILGFSAVGDNTRFKNDLSKFNLTYFKGYRDHFKFTQRELLSLENSRKQREADYLVCTEKDMVRIFQFSQPDIPLIYVKNHIKYSINLIDIILTNAKNAGFI